MKTSFLIAGAITLVLTFILSYVYLTLIAAGFRKKYCPQTSPNLAQGLLLAGKSVAGLVLISGIFPPIRDFLLVSASGTDPFSSAFWGFVFICCCITGVFYVLLSLFEEWISHKIFRGQSLVVELRENNLAVGLTRAAIISVLAFTLLFSCGMFLQAFIPLPAIPNIR